MDTTFSTRLRDGERLFGVTLTIPDPFIAELISQQGFDFLLIDMEHSPAGPTQVQTQLIALAGGTAAGLVRVASVDPTAIMQALDLGADGVVVPHVESPEDARLAVSATRYPPEGERGVGPRRASRIHRDREPYFRRANGERYLGIMIESKRGLDNLAEILAVDGIDAVILGEADLAASLGHLGDAAHPDVTSAVDLVARRCLEAGVPYGMYAPTAGRARAFFEQGASFVTVGSDLLFLEQRMGQVVEEFGGLRAVPLPTSP